jgi:hypothetical protein
LGLFDRQKNETKKRKHIATGAHREPTAAERAAFEEMLLGHDLEGAQLQAMAFALKRTRKNETMARQLVLRARTLLWERCTWNPAKVGLGRYLRGLIRSEISHEAEKEVTRRDEEQEYLADFQTTEGRHARSPEDLAVACEESEDGRKEAARELETLKAHFVANGDAVNLLWIQYSLDEIDDPAEMARLSGRDVTEFYRARDRRVRLVQRMLAAKRGSPKD